ncbi:MAG: oligoribonuclease [Candidatus Saccharimonadales bacterium]
MIDKNAVATKLLWIDLEMTGLDSRSDVILEVAAEVTDFAFTPIASYEAIIMQPEDKLANMNEWCVEQHTKSGLLDRLRNEGRAETDVINELTTFIAANFADEPVILAGNSIHNDRQFIKFWWPPVDQLLHYRMLDVSSFKIIMQSKYGVMHQKKEVHRAYDDIHASILELKEYLDWLQDQTKVYES